MNDDHDDRYRESLRQFPGKEPTYEELKAALEEIQREDEEQALDQIGEICVAMGWQKEPQPSQPVKLCGHLREDGSTCRSIAVRDREFCSFHLNHRGRRLCIARARARRERLPLQLPPLEDLYAVQVGIMQVTDWLLNGKLDRRDARLALSGLRQAAANLRQPPEVWENSRPFQSQEQLELPGFEAEHGLPQGIDVKSAPEAVFPETETGAPSLSASLADRVGEAALSEDEVNLMEVTPTDIELMEIRQQKGPEAVWRKLKQLDAAEQRRYQRAQRQLAHCRHVVRAAAQNAARETYYVAKSEVAVAAAEAAEAAEQAEGVGEQAGAPPLTGADVPPLSPAAGERVVEGNPAGAPPLSPSVGDRVGDEGRKEPQSVTSDTATAEVKLG